MTDEDRLRRALLDIVHINTQLSEKHPVSYDDLYQAIVRIDQVMVGVRDILFVQDRGEGK